MQAGERYRFKTPTFGLRSTEDRRRVPVLISKGAVVQTIAALNGEKMVEVMLEGNSIMMFAEDLRTRGELVKSQGS